jgi:hypothetical protein
LAKKVTFFILYKIREQESGTGPVRGIGKSGSRKRWRKGVGGRI